METTDVAQSRIAAHEELQGAWRIIMDAEMGEPRDPNEDPRIKALLLEMTATYAARVFDAMQQAGYIPDSETRPTVYYSNGELAQYTLPRNLDERKAGSER
jgi:hypothetical protein